jgi:CubicO group peptidase (beta-lactamase class C family)
MHPIPDTRIVGEPPCRGQCHTLLGAFAASAAMLLGCGCTVVRTVVHNFADLDDHRIFANREIEAAPRASALRALSRPPRFIETLQVPDEHGASRPLERYLDDTRTAAFVVLHEDRIVYERYARGYDERSLLNSFSIAKSIVATLVGIAVAEGLLDPEGTVASYRPDLAHTAYGPVPVKRLISMTSGVADRPSLLPGRAQYYYGDDLQRVVAGARASAGNEWRYSEADVQVLGFVLAAATGRTLSDYLSEKLWRPLGMEAKALWALDRPGGSEKAFCCISARARDFARMGKLYLDEGRRAGERLAPASWIARTALPGVRTPDGYTHRHLWWMPEGGEDDFYAYGHNGQYLYVNPRARVVIVKFSETLRQDPVPMLRAVAGAIARPAHLAEIERLEAPNLALR